MQEIRIHEVGMRDGLQMEVARVPTEEKLKWIEDLDSSGVDIVQVGSFVHPKYVPQMADTDGLFEALRKKSHRAILSGLVLNEKGVDRGLRCSVELFCMGVSASETHSLKNTRMPVNEAVDRTIAMARLVLSEGKAVQVSVQSAFGCGFEGNIPEQRVLSIVERYLEEGLKSISLADTAGHANPQQVARLFGKIKELDGSVETACHLHNTYGVGIANCMAALDSGVTTFESSFGGLGGCPFTAVAGGNVCTEDLVHLFQRMGLCKQLDLPRLINVANSASRYLNRELPGSVYKSGPIEANIRPAPAE